MIMNLRTMFKIILFSIFGVLISIGTLVASLMILPNEYGILLAIVLGFLFSVALLILIPVFFRQYIDMFWRLEESKKCQEKEVRKQ